MVGGNMDVSNKRIALNFDLDQTILKDYNKKPLKLYKELEHFLNKNDFDKRQQSSFLSKKGLEITDVLYVIDNAKKKFKWFQPAINNFTATYENDIMDLIPIAKDDENFLDFSNKKNELISNNEEEKKQIAIHFDLSIKEIDNYFSYRSKPYKQIEKVMKNHNFFHQQGSGYISENEISKLELFEIVNELKINVRHFEDIVKHLDSTHLDKIWDLKSYINNKNLTNQILSANNLKNKKKSSNSPQAEMKIAKEIEM